MNKRILLALFALAASVALHAQDYSGGVKGTVVNRNGRQPVENARLTRTVPSRSGTFPTGCTPS